MLSTEIDLAKGPHMSPSDWGYVSEMCMEALIRSGSPNDGQPSSPSEENSTAEDSSDFGLSSPTYPLTDTMIPSAISTSSRVHAPSQLRPDRTTIESTPIPRLQQSLLDLLASNREKPASHELVTTIRQPPVRATRFVPYSVTDRPPTLATRALTSSSSFYSKVFCRKGKYPQLAATHGINDQALYYGWKADYVTCYIPGCNQEVIKNTRAEVSKHVKKFHLYAEDPQYVMRDCCPAASAADRFVKVEMVYGHFQTERHSLIHNSHQYSCGYCRDVAARPDQLDSHFFECRTLRNYVLSLRSAPPQTSFYSTSLSLGV
ncbi:hypothetical protein EV421DRAFT_1911515 [Armillaria borealis]|uniref:Uncharacterized protein n=1 Tax=Armillaria borealis TaxID=47425 RepID=A0AA39MEE3_9AGAR|nr:hypothetical protein EV421DRAFT_1911515 [Armillaria borealis]